MCINRSIELVLHKQLVEGHCLVYRERGHTNSSLSVFPHAFLCLNFQTKFGFVCVPVWDPAVLLVL